MGSSAWTRLCLGDAAAGILHAGVVQELSYVIERQIMRDKAVRLAIDQYLTKVESFNGS